MVGSIESGGLCQLAESPESLSYRMCRMDSRRRGSSLFVNQQSLKEQATVFVVYDLPEGKNVRFWLTIIFIVD